MRYITLFVLQLVCLGVVKDLLLLLDVTLSFLDICRQHLQPGVAHPADCPVRFGVMLILTGSVDLGGSLACFSFARTKVWLKFLVLFRLMHGLGIESSCSGSGFIRDLISLTSMSGVYSTTKNVSYWHGAGSFSLKISCLAEKGTVC